MIEEKFIESAIQIRRTYLKLTNNLNMYQKKAQEIVSVLETTISKLENLQKEINDSKTGKGSLTTENAVNELLSTISGVQEEGDRLNRLFDPLNEEIEKLGKEESQLWNQIIERHKDIPQDKIVEIFKNRLESEGLI